MLEKKKRIRLKKDFDRVFKRGNSFYCKSLGVKHCENKLGFSRFGVIVSTKISKKAVERIRIKRVIKNFFSNNYNNIANSKDFVIICLPEIKDKKKEEIEAILIDVFSKIKCYKK